MQWSMDGTVMTRPATPGVGPEGPATHTFFQALLDEQRALPEPSIRLIRVFLEAEIDGRPLTDREIVTQLHFMLQAGVHTTRGFLTHLMNRLVQDPEILPALRADGADGGLIAQYLEESLRHDAPVQRTTRLCTADTTIGDVPIRSGEWVEMGIASANRDDLVYDDGQTFSLNRPDPRRHLAFGAGSHVCPGAALARREGELAVRRAARPRLPGAPGRRRQLPADPGKPRPRAGARPARAVAAASARPRRCDFLRRLVGESHSTYQLGPHQQGG